MRRKTLLLGCVVCLMILFEFSSFEFYLVRAFDVRSSVLNDLIKRILMSTWTQCRTIDLVVFRDAFNSPEWHSIYIVCGLTLQYNWMVCEIFFRIVSWLPKVIHRQFVSLLFEHLNFFCTTLSLCQRFALISFSRKPLKRGRFHLFIYFLLFLVTKWIRTLRKKLFALARVHLMYAQCRMCVCNFVSLAEFNLIGLNSHADSFMFTTRPMLMELYNNFECS